MLLQVVTGSKLLEPFIDPVLSIAGRAIGMQQPSRP